MAHEPNQKEKEADRQAEKTPLLAYLLIALIGICVGILLVSCVIGIR